MKLKIKSVANADTALNIITAPKTKTVLLGQTRSVCPVCLASISAAYISREDDVYLEKKCELHGAFSVKVWSGVNDFRKWYRGRELPQPEAEVDCPHECKNCLSHGQEVCCVLLEVTSRCNLRCPVCFAQAGNAGKKDPDTSDIAGWYDMLMERGGPFNIQLSGGEPTIREDLPEIISLGKQKGFSFFQLNTNGLRIADDPEYLAGLIDAGLNTVFLQFDGFSASTGIALRGTDLVEKKLKAIENCIEAGIGVVLVPTVVSGVNDGELGKIIEFAAARLPTVRGVHFQPISKFGRYENIGGNGRITIPELLRKLEEQTSGKIRASDFVPSGAEHPLCSFHADYTVKRDMWTLQNLGDSTCCSSKQAREVVARKWSLFGPSTHADDKLSKYNLDALDEFLSEKSEKTLAISGMAFQDAWNLDIERLRFCYVFEVGGDGALIPFCAYNLTAQDGRTIYRR